jgi:hypothetical protein
MIEERANNYVIRILQNATQKQIFFSFVFNFREQLYQLVKWQLLVNY